MEKLMDSNFPPEVILSGTDAQYLRLAIAHSHAARERGNRPFGAVIVTHTGETLVEFHNQGVQTKDCTAHAETGAIRLACQHHSRDVLRNSTLYASGEPCVMCCGAIFLSGIRRVVYALDSYRLRKMRGLREDYRDLEWSIHEIYQASPHPMECIGPALLEEATPAHLGFWQPQETKD
jgi:tRNA(adenine34) deaminase